MSTSYSQSGKTYILVHGAWHGAWSWDKVIPLMQAKGDKAIAVDLPGHGTNPGRTADITLDAYVNEVTKAANDQKGPVSIFARLSYEGVQILICYQCHLTIALCILQLLKG